MVSTKKVANLEQLRGVKVWAWEGDRLVEHFSQEMKISSVPLALPDVLTSLSTGIVDAAYASAMGIVALQWSSKIKYLVDFPVTYAIGGLLISSKEWQKVGQQDRQQVQKIVATNLQKTTEETIEENAQALEALRSLGVEFIKFPESDISEIDRIATGLLDKLQQKKVFSSEMVARFRELMASKTATP